MTPEEADAVKSRLWYARLLAEPDQLQDRIVKLQSFILNGGIAFFNLTEDDRNDLKEQLVHMRRYYAVLVSRLARHSQ